MDEGVDDGGVGEEEEEEEDDDDDVEGEGAIDEDIINEDDEILFENEKVSVDIKINNKLNEKIVETSNNELITDNNLKDCHVHVENEPINADDCGHDVIVIVRNNGYHHNNYRSAVDDDDKLYGDGNNNKNIIGWYYSIYCY